MNSHHIHHQQLNKPKPSRGPGLIENLNSSISSGHTLFRKSDEDINAKIKKVQDRKKKEIMFSASAASKPSFRSSQSGSHTSQNMNGSSGSFNNLLSQSAYSLLQEQSMNSHGISASQALSLIQKRHPKLLKQHFGPGFSSHPFLTMSRQEEEKKEEGLQ